MLKSCVALFAVGLGSLLVLHSSLPAQPTGKDDVKKLEAELEKLRDQVKDTEARLAKAKEQAEKKGRFDPFGKGGFGPKGFEGFKKGGFGKGFEGKKGFGPRGFEDKKKPELIDPATVKAKYDFYKKLYDELPKERSRSPFAAKGKAADTSIDARLERLQRELEELRRDLRKTK